MANPEHLAILKQGVAVWNEWKSKTAERADLSGTALRGANLLAENLRVDKTGVALFDMRCRGVDLVGANLSWADLDGAMLNYADLRGANLARANLRATHLNDADLGGANLQDAFLREADLSDADFWEANLLGVDLFGANLNLTNLTRANICNANLTGANLHKTNLTEADLSKANLSKANLNEMELNRTNLTDAIFGFTIFSAVDLSTAQGLESANHRSPSTIGIDTLYKSKGKIPKVFLRGCGVPDSLIAQARALIGAEDGIQFYSCFISYSGLDEEFARRLHGRLQQEHVRVWFAPHDIQGGKKLHEQIDEAIKVYDKLLILLSPNSLKSEWVMTELRKARKAERKTGKRKLFPVGLVDYATLQEWECFDADGGKDLAVEVREYFIPDFSNWKDHDAFEKGFARLLKDLRAEEKAAA